jgi:hypothetical protein
MIISMLCWGSWANAVKLTPGYRSQLFYWDYVIGLILGAFAWGLCSLGATGRPLIADGLHTDMAHIGWAIAGGVIFNVANLQLVAAIDIAGLAVAFPVFIRAWSRHLFATSELPDHATAVGSSGAGFDEGLLAGILPLALVGTSGRSDLVYRRGIELPGVSRASGGTQRCPIRLGKGQR